jgi:hypothetical protein
MNDTAHRSIKCNVYQYTENHLPQNTNLSSNQIDRLADDSDASIKYHKYIM